MVGSTTSTGTCTGMEKWWRRDGKVGSFNRSSAVNWVAKRAFHTGFVISKAGSTVRSLIITLLLTYICCCIGRGSGGSSRYSCSGVGCVSDNKRLEVGVGYGMLPSFLFVDAIACNISVGELDALEALYYATNGSGWNWRTADDDTQYYYEPYENGTSIWVFPASVSDPCSNNWQGITCKTNTTSTLSSPSCYIESLELILFNLQGTLPSNISQLSGLSSLKLGYNSLSGSIISEISKLSRLSYLDLLDNYLTSSIPTELYSLTNLTFLRLYNNHLNGNISCALSSISRLEKINLGGNHFTGSICRDMSALTNLYFLGLKSNSLTGVIPNELSSLTLLTTLLLNSNLLTGEIPSSLSSLSSLVSLYLDNNSLRGTVTSRIAALTSLFNLFLSTNSLTGAIPTTLSALLSLNYLDMSGNLLTGNIPSDLSSLSSLNFLDLSANSITGTIPAALSSLTLLTYFHLDNNYLIGVIPNKLSSLTLLSSLYLNNNAFTGTIPYGLGNLKLIQTLQLNDNKLKSSIPSSFSALADLILLYLQGNLLTSYIPSDMFNNLKQMQVIDLSNNRLEGTLPASISILKPTLVYFAASNNRFTGNSFFFLGFPHIRFANISYNHFGDMPRLIFESSSSSLYYSCPELNFLDISNNYLTGSLQDSIGTVFHNLTLLSASNNALLSYIPESLCKMKNLTTLLLSGLGNRSSSLVINYDEQRSSFTIPSCLLSLSLLETANLASNALYGTIGEIGPNIASLSLVGNLLTGTIPYSIQRSSSKLNNLQLSINRLSGTLVDDAFLNMDTNSTINLYSNRISGDIPDSITRFVGVGGGSKPNILTGNVFNCTGYKAPSNLVDYQTFSCGSSSIDFYKYVYLCFGIALVMSILLFMTWIRRRRVNKSSSLNLRTETKMKEEKKNTMILFLIYFQHRPFPTELFKGLVSPQFITSSCLVALFMTFFNLGYTANEDHSKTSFRDAFITVFDRYGWTPTFIYVHGVLPFLLVVIGLSILLFVYLYYWFAGTVKVLSIVTTSSFVGAISNTSTTPTTLFATSIHSSASSSVDSANNAGLESNEASNTSKSLLSSRIFASFCEFKSVLLSYCKECSSSFLSFFDTPVKRYMIFLQLVNVVVITGMNVLYIIAETSTAVGVTYKNIIPIGLSMFKIIWANTFVIYLTKYGIRSKLSVDSVFANYIFALVYLFVLVPIITVFFRDHDCFYYPIFSQVGPITEVYPSVISSDPICYCTENSCNTYTCPIVYDATIIKQTITPTWIYGYQCGVQILTNYVPTMLSTYTIKGVILPILKLFLLSLPPNSWIRNVWLVKKSLLQYTLNAMSEENLGGDEDRQFRTLVFVSKLLSDLLMLLTYGILCPFLTFIIIWSILANEIVDHIQVGSYVYDIARIIDKKEEENEDENEVVAELASMKSISFTSTSTKIATSTNTPNQLEEGLNKGSLSMHRRSSTVTVVGSPSDIELTDIRSSSISNSKLLREVALSEVEVEVGDSGLANHYNSMNSDADNTPYRSASRSQQAIITSTTTITPARSSFLNTMATDNTVVIKSTPSRVDKVGFQFELTSRIYLGNARELVMSVWSPMVIVILFFMTLILFDIIADVYGNFAGLVSVIIVWLFVYLLFGSGKSGLDRIVSCLKGTRIRTCEILDEKKNHRKENGVDVEIKSVQDNPMAETS